MYIFLSRFMRASITSQGAVFYYSDVSYLCKNFIFPNICSLFQTTTSPCYLKETLTDSSFEKLQKLFCNF